MAQLTYADIEDRVTTVQQEVTFRNTFFQTPDDWVATLYKALNWTVDEMARNRELRKDRSEDELTIEVVSLLRAMSYSASHEAKEGGHCDIIVEGGRNYRWLGEAKKHDGSYKWLHDGFLQLMTRYAAGTGTSRYVGILVYVYQKQAVRVLERWKEHLIANEPPKSVDKCELSDLAFISSHEHEGTGLDLSVRHMVYPLYHEPLK